MIFRRVSRLHDSAGAARLVGIVQPFTSAGETMSPESSKGHIPGEDVTLEHTKTELYS
jgi:hypothetical protein